MPLPRLSSISSGVQKALKGRAKDNVIKGMQSAAAPGAAVGGVLGGIHGAVTDDPNNPQEGRLGRMISHAAGGALMGGAGGAAYGGGKAHIGNLESAAHAKGLFQGAAGGLAAGGLAAGGAALAKSPTVRAGAQKVMQGAGAAVGKGKAIVKGFMNRGAAKAKPTSNLGANMGHAPSAAPMPAPAAPRDPRSMMAANMGQGPSTAPMPAPVAAPVAAPVVGAPGSRVGMNMGHAPSSAGPSTPVPANRGKPGTWDNPNVIESDMTPAEMASQRAHMENQIAKQRYPLGAPEEYGSKAASPDFWTGFMTRAYREY